MNTVFGILLILLSGLMDTGDYLTVSAVGDIMMGSTFPKDVLPPDDSSGLFNDVTATLRDSDIVFGNLEGPLLDGGTPEKCRGRQSKLCYEFKTPTRYATHLKKAGFNVLSIANNHACDFGKEGIENTIETLVSSGIQPAGGEQVALFVISGKKVAIVGFSFSSCGHYSHSILNIKKAEETVSALKKANDIVIVSFHGGAEGKTALRIPDGDEPFAGERRGDVVRFSRAVIDAGADMVIGHGPHVPRAIELYKGKLIAYSLGNFLTFGRFNLEGPSGVSLVLRVKLAQAGGAFVSGRIIPVRLLGGGVPSIDSSNEAVQLMRHLTMEHGGTVIIEEDGSIKPAPLSPEGSGLTPD